DAWDVTRSLFRGRLPEEPVSGKFYLGRFGDDKSVCDEVVLAVKEEWLELHCHGGGEVVRFIEELFAQRGVVVYTWREFVAARLALPLSFPSPPYSGERGRSEGDEPPYASPPHPRPLSPEYGGEGTTPGLDILNTRSSIIALE